MDETRIVLVGTWRSCIRDPNHKPPDGQVDRPNRRLSNWVMWCERRA